MSNTNTDPMMLNDEEVAEDSFLFYNPSTNDYTSFPTDIPDLLSASAQVYADDMDTDLVWPEDHENVALAEPSASAIEQARPQIDSWRSHVNALITQHEESLLLSPWVLKQVAFLQTRPSRAPSWIRKAATINRNTLDSYEQTRPDLSLSDVEKVTIDFWNERGRVASWIFSRAFPAHAVPLSFRQDMTAARADLADSWSDMNIAGFPEITVRNTDDTRSVRAMIAAIDLNQGTLENIQQQEQSVSQRQLSEVRDQSHMIRQLYDDLRWGEKGPVFQELLGTWNGSLRDLKEAGVTELAELADPPE
ncbi:hypothetical protein B9479_005521 [Cryptococcus floricola]|uniref:Uncharacterized protein n=1 Tax=Cryptococcus floricola TaxID=2591691 RepID=A0A5D3AQS0_9TREE|nr:hypothetical protein B9479_005521 [Cryptococcus floricola]